MQKGFAPILVLVGVLVIALIAGGAYYFSKVKTPALKICTMDAKVCPDGSSVGRVGPNCEFAACPIPKSSPSSTPSDETSNWKTYKNNRYKFEIKYPVMFVEWGESTAPFTISLQRELDTNTLLGDALIIKVFEENEYQQYHNNPFPSSVGDIASSVKKTNKAKTNKLIINNKEALEVIYGDGKSLERIGTEPDLYKGPREYFLLWDGKLYSIEYYTDDSEIIGTFNQILSTFKFLDQEQTANNPKSCVQDNDCALLQCSGCFNTDWVETAPPDLPCLRYAGYSCQCANNACLEVRK